MRSVRNDSRGVSEGASIGALVLLTVVITASVGLGVLVADTGEEEGIDASFSFQYFSERAALLITYEDGPELQADTVLIREAGREIDWATLRDLNESAAISPGDRVQLNPNNQWDARVTGRNNVSVVYVEGDNESVLDQWSAGN